VDRRGAALGLFDLGEQGLETFRHRLAPLSCTLELTLLRAQARNLAAARLTPAPRPRRRIPMNRRTAACRGEGRGQLSDHP